MRPDVLRRFMKYANARPNGCWEWGSYIDPCGYGRLFVDGKSAKAHRLSYEHFKGLIPNGLEIDHLCRNRKCCNPDHLEVVTRAENQRRGESGQNNRIKTHCPQGHPYSMENTRFYVNKNGIRRRSCRACGRTMDKAYNARRPKRQRNNGGIPCQQQSQYH